jgi:chromosome segregation ATPase
MSNIEDLQARITAALDRASAGIEAISSTGGGEGGDLQAQLEEEKTVSAQLEERLRAIKEKHASELASAQSETQDTRAKVDALDLELQRLRQSNQQLREANAALREANEAGVGDPHLINKAMLAELEALRAARATDVAEASAILSALAPVLNGTNAQEGEA